MSPTSATSVHRSRATSFGSSKSTPLSQTNISASGRSLAKSAIFPDYSQSTLENVINSRLVETFLTITVVPAVSNLIPSISVASTPKTPTSTLAATQRKVVSGNMKSPPRVTGKPLQQQDQVRDVARRNTLTSVCLGGTASSSHVRSNSVITSRSASKPGNPLSPTFSSSTSPIPPSPATPILEEPITPIPNFLSPIHRPSTNPQFFIDEDSTRSFSPWTDFSSTKFQAEIWGHLLSSTKLSDKGKMKRTITHTTNKEWRVLGSWQVDTSDLLPLNSVVCNNTSSEEKWDAHLT